MRIKAIELSWFRGAGSLVSLEPNGKSIVVYGANGSGKSSFADALEYIVASGKIAHLSHEYSGTKQREGTRNTHAPEDAFSEVKITCKDHRYVTGKLAPTGKLSFQSGPPDTKEIFQCIDLERFLLRQDEVAKFIHATKGQKYSVLLPLLGLEKMEQSAVNLLNLKKSLEKQSGLIQKRQQLIAHKDDVLKHLPDLAPDTIEKKLTTLAATYLETSPIKEMPQLLDSLLGAVSDRINQAEPEHSRHFLCKQIEEDDLSGKLIALNRIEEEAAELVDELLDHQIAVLESTAEYIQHTEERLEKITCPACGKEISLDEFKTHVKNEVDSLTSIRGTREILIKARKEFVGAIIQLKKRTIQPELIAWLKEPAQKVLNKALSCISHLELNGDGKRWGSQTWDILRKEIPVIHAGFSEAVKSTPPSTQDLIEAKQIIAACRQIPKISKLEDELSGLDQIFAILDETEKATRDAIRKLTKSTILRVSTEVQKLWKKLHPDEPIEAVQLYIPKDADKAIDICLKFFGVDQPSPRLSLSEGHRNSLGLCIFLALVKLDDENDRPIVLDDVVSSLDREHRGMLAKVFLEDFSDRQVIVLTHDREWYSELRARLPAKHWGFLTLKPWTDPMIGIQWAHSKETFDDARALLEINPTAAGNRARAIMDTQMAIAAEKLFVPVLYARGDRNDHRTCIEFLERIISIATKALRKKQGTNWPVFPDPIANLEEARNLLLSWGNRASHTGILTNTEAEELIQVCEEVLFHFRCEECNDPIWIANQISRKRLQCSCGIFQWRYG
jgi:energy-coupling factor transporter ATP-binding protein EcfA2